MMHVKTMMVDGLISVAGSANFDNRSFELNDELSFAVSDRQFAAELTRDFEQDLTRSKRLILDDWKQRGFVAKVQERFWGLFGELF
jgi:cardiolipin synthase